MADEDVVGDREPLLTQEGLRSRISLVFLKFIGAFLLASALFYLLIDNLDADSLSSEEQDALSIMRPLMKESSVQEHLLDKVCDLSIGEWVPNSAGPAYTNKTCNRIPQHNNCLKNGRPDRGYLYWRWKPRFCDLPPFDPVTFMHAMGNKSWAFIGDSIYQNHVHSLLCQLSQVEAPHVIYQDLSFNIIWHFPSYNIKIYEIWSPLLIQYETIHNDVDFSKIMIRLHLDILDSSWTRFYNLYDYVVIEWQQVVLTSQALYMRKKQSHWLPLLTWSPMHYEDGELPNERVRTVPYHPFDGDNKKNVENDCNHWCLPGPIDTVNDMLMKMVMNGDAHDPDSAIL
ncbi:protein trichome birefringence-like 26 [Dioscorea cayenensis subsp. rotundata]|uniref:Protein trichome birefringence-like 26 n=1 Tax=Dioscorea cayennensis subsp. rotundata TaxID=55577 RepID=A0AB40B5Y1_DIOCR|nr:protein trichome birefringence-like 26 [Dioscorea cayenensis subsp. rotundata]